MNGIVLVDKPRGPTSFDVVRDVRRASRERSVGHTGTLDPMASGLLVVCLGEATKLVPYLMDSDKRYQAIVALGTATDTDDALGQIVEQRGVPSFDEQALEVLRLRYLGSITQVPPVYAAIKQGGEPLYRKARRGESVEVPPRTVTIDELGLQRISERELSLEVRCGKGTYIRALARDLARDLGTVGHLTSLRRLETSGYKVDAACGLEQLHRAATGEAAVPLIPIETALGRFLQIRLSPEAEDHIRHGRPCDMDGALPLEPETKIALLRPDGVLLAIGRVLDATRVTSERMFHL